MGSHPKTAADRVGLLKVWLWSNLKALSSVTDENDII